MSRRWRVLALCIACLGVGIGVALQQFVFGAQPAKTQDLPLPVEFPGATKDNVLGPQVVLNYWTDERMRSAVPFELPRVEGPAIPVPSAQGNVGSEDSQQPEDGSNDEVIVPGQPPSDP